MKGLQANHPASRELLCDLFLRYPLVIPQGHDVRGECLEDEKDVLVLIAQDDPIGDSCLFHIASSVLLVMVGSDSLYPPDRLVPGNNDNELAT